MSRDIRDIQEKKPRERRTLRQLWALLKQNLKDWDWYRKEHPDRFTLDIQSGVKHLAQDLRERIAKLCRDIKRLARRDRANEFPEAERRLFQLLLLCSYSSQVEFLHVKSNSPTIYHFDGHKRPEAKQP